MNDKRDVRKAEETDQYDVRLLQVIETKVSCQHKFKSPGSPSERDREMVEGIYSAKGTTQAWVGLMGPRMANLGDEGGHVQEIRERYDINNVIRINRLISQVDQHMEIFSPEGGKEGAPLGFVEGDLETVGSVEGSLLGDEEGLSDGSKVRGASSIIVSSNLSVCSFFLS